MFRTSPVSLYTVGSRNDLHDDGDWACKPPPHILQSQFSGWKIHSDLVSLFSSPTCVLAILICTYLVLWAPSCCMNSAIHIISPPPSPYSTTATWHRQNSSQPVSILISKVPYETEKESITTRTGCATSTVLFSIIAVLFKNTCMHTRTECVASRWP